MFLIKVILIGENISGWNSNFIYVLNVFVIKDIYELLIIFYGNIFYDIVVMINLGDLGFIDILYCLKFCVFYCKRCWLIIKICILFNVEKVWKIKENRVFMILRNW